MKSASYRAGGYSYVLPWKKPLLREAERLVSEYGDKADLVAAQFADSSFRAGNRTAGNRWAKVFRVLAKSHIRHMKDHARTTPTPVTPDVRSGVELR
jgi:hypothetical protein